MICSKCQKNGIPAGDMTTTYNGDRVCKDCLNEFYYKCFNCGEFYPNNTELIGTDDKKYCEVCWGEHFFVCECCDGTFDRDDLCVSGGENLCQDCYSDSDDYPEEDILSTANEQTTKFQNKQKGSFICSRRTFGVELELLGNARDVRLSIDEAFGITRDGSIQPSGDFDNSFELVSPILRGKAGELALINVCEILNINDIGINNTCGMHIHLGARDFLPRTNEDLHYCEFEDSSYKKPDVVAVYFFPKKLYEEYRIKINNMELIEKLRSRGELKQLRSNGKKHADHFHYYSPKQRREDYNNAKPFEEPDYTIPTYKKDDVVIYTTKSDVRILYLRNLLLFYIAFEPFLFATQPRSRREGNSYAQSLQKAFSFQDVLKISSFEDFEKYWYKKTKEREIYALKGQHYDNSRYYTVNFHSLLELSRRNTVEIRLHAGTKNATKVLNWVNLHQTILDKILNGKIESSCIDRAYNIFLLEEKIDYFFKILELTPDVEKYFRKRIRIFTLQIKKGSNGSEQEVEALY